MIVCIKASPASPTGTRTLLKHADDAGSNLTGILAGGG
jgi:hypothetical protein